MPGWVFKALVSRAEDGPKLPELYVVREPEPVTALVNLHAVEPQLHPDDLERHGGMSDEVMGLLGMSEGGIGLLDVGSWRAAPSRDRGSESPSAEHL